MPNSSWARLQAAPASTPRRIVPRRIVNETVEELRERSAGWRESACIWAGTHDGNVRQVIFHHKIANDRGSPLSLELPERAKLDLYQRLASEGQTVLALLHTHPEDWVGLSLVDQSNQISSRVGFWSIVLPFYARNNWSTAEIGFHIRAERGWRALSFYEVISSLSITE